MDIEKNTVLYSVSVLRVTFIQIVARVICFEPNLEGNAATRASVESLSERKEESRCC